MTSPLRTAVIGTGYLGRFHAQKYAQHPDCSLIGVCDHNPDHANRVAEELSCPAFNHHTELFGQVDAVSIASTTSSHWEIARDCLAQGIHVLLEKPMTTTVDEANELIALAKEHNCILQIGHLERYNNAIKTLYPLLDSPRFISCQRLAPFQERGTDVSVILDLMIHDIDLVLSMVDSPVTDIQATGARVFSEHADIVNARLSFKNGCIADFTTSRINEKPRRFMQVYQHDVSFDVDMHHKRLTSNRLIQEPTPHIQRDKQRFERNDALKEQIADFCHNVRTHTQAAVDGHAGKNALEIAIAVSDAVTARTAAS